MWMWLILVIVNALLVGFCLLYVSELKQMHQQLVLLKLVLLRTFQSNTYLFNSLYIRNIGDKYANKFIIKENIKIISKIR